MGLESEPDEPLPPEIARWIEDQYAHGHVNSTMSVDTGEQRIVVVGGTRIYAIKSSWTFTDFLHWYCIRRLGREWFIAEREKPGPQWHPIVEWRERAREFRKRHSRGLRDGEHFSAIA